MYPLHCLGTEELIYQEIKIYNYRHAKRGLFISNIFIHHQLGIMKAAYAMNFGPTASYIALSTRPTVQNIRTLERVLSLCLKSLTNTMPQEIGITKQLRKFCHLQKITFEFEMNLNQNHTLMFWKQKIVIISVLNLLVFLGLLNVMDKYFLKLTH